jgi:hypothetical protein
MKNMLLTSTKYGLGKNLGDFFQKTSGHPGGEKGTYF